MAIINLNSKMVHWKISIGNVDVTNEIGPFVSSFSVKDTIMPAPKKSKKEHAPSEAEIVITSKDYIEDFFIRGNTIKIKAGYDRILQPEVFSGVITHVPDGSAREMLNYTVKAYGMSIELAYAEKIRVFPIPSKSVIVAQIAAENGWTPFIKIKDTSMIKAQFAPIQKAKTDLEVLYDFAKAWGCICWFEQATKKLYFVDADDAHSTPPPVTVTSSVPQNGMPSSVGGIYMLGYRNDKVRNNVLSVSWKQEPPRAAGAVDGGVAGFGEFGPVQSNDQGKILALGETWELKPQYAAEARNKPYMFGKYLALVTAATVTGNAYKGALFKYYQVATFNDSAHKDVPTGPNASGYKIEVDLNEGDPDVKPPRKAWLYAGSMKYNADSSNLPAWLFANGPKGKPPAKLNINETELKFSHGMLTSKFICSMGI